jgi:ribonuclease R
MTKNTSGKKGGTGNKTPATGGKGQARRGAGGNPRAPAKESSGPRGGRGSAPARPAWLPDAPAPAARDPYAERAREEAARRASRPKTPGAGSAPGVDPFAAREARRYEKPIPSREAILALLAEADGPLGAAQIAQKLALQDPDQVDALDKRLAAMLRDGQLLANRRGDFAVAQRLDLISGTVIANPEGFGFLRTETGGDDLFLPPGEMRKVMHGDRVLASVTGVDRRGRREGAIVEVLERRLTRLIGRYEERGGIGYVVPDDRRILHDVLIPPDAREGAKVAQLVVAEIVEAQRNGRPPFGRILTVLGDKLTPSLVVEAAIHGHGLSHEFPREVLDEAAQIPLAVDAATAAKRVDLRAMPLVTIDGEDAKDFDDAVWCEPNRNGFRLVVAIADVSHYVRPGTPLDDEAQDRATSVYFPGFVVPMLPETLSNGICSLKPKVDRLCFVCDMQVDRAGAVTQSKFYEAVMHSHARLTYTQVWKALAPEQHLHGEGEEALAQVGELLPRIRELHQLYQVLARARAERGAIEFESGEVRFVLGPEGEVVQAGMLERNDAHKLIEECMIAANVEAAAFLLEREIPAPYRIHDRPPENKYAELLEFLGEFGLRMPPWGKVKPGDFTALLQKVRKRPDAGLIESVLLRSQSLAVYSPDNIGHFGLALAHYAHFTSPIRRYPDLLVHRAIKAALSNKKYFEEDWEALGRHCSETERRADDASRDVENWLKCYYMRDHVGGTFSGIITGVVPFGLFVTLDDYFVDGLVHISELGRDYFTFDAARHQLLGERTGRRYRLADRMTVKLVRVDLETRKIDFVPHERA